MSRLDIENHSQYGESSMCARDEEVSTEESLKAEICPCGTVTIRVGPFSLRWSQKSFFRFAHFIEEVRNRCLKERVLPHVKAHN